MPNRLLRSSNRLALTPKTIRAMLMPSSHVPGSRIRLGGFTHAIPMTAEILMAAKISPRMAMNFVSAGSLRDFAFTRTGCDKSSGARVASGLGDC